jgi:hypothetical protein
MVAESIAGEEEDTRMSLNGRRCLGIAVMLVSIMATGVFAVIVEDPPKGDPGSGVGESEDGGGPGGGCSLLDPLCWLEDVICLIGGRGSELVSKFVEVDFDECAMAPQRIEAAILAQLRLYFMQTSFDSVWIHRDCNLDGDVVPGSRDAITFGEHIYFGPGQYHPFDPWGFGLLAHELTHVLQYRQKGRDRFTCEYGLECGFGADNFCAIEQAAYRFEREVVLDQLVDGDGNFSNNGPRGVPCPSYKAPCMDE